MKRWTTTKTTVAGVLVACLLCCATAEAKKGGKPGGGGGGEEPSAAAVNPAIVFVAQQKNGRNDIIVASSDLSSEIVLTGDLQFSKKEPPRIFGSPAWSWDGSSVAFWVQNGSAEGLESQMKLYIAAADGSSLTLVRDFSTRFNHNGPNYTSSGLNWTWSGQELIYWDSDGIVSIDAMTGDTQILIEGYISGAPTGQPSLSPDLDAAPGYQGYIATVGQGAVDGFTDIFLAPIADDVDGYLLSVDPISFVNLTNSSMTHQLHPSWSPDGLELAVFNDEELAVINIGSGVQRFFTGGYFTHVNAADRAAWSSDGLELIYRSTLIGPTELSITNADTSTLPINYTNSSASEWSPAWNPMWNPSGP